MIPKFMVNETNDLIDNLYEKKKPIHSEHNSQQIIRKSPKAKYQIFDEVEFTHGREVLGNLIVHGMIASGGTDIDFSNPDLTIWVFEMSQWNSGAIPKNTSDIYGEDSGMQNKFIVYREYMEEISVEKLRGMVDSHWKEFERIKH
jgi:hypothetical protein